MENQSGAEQHACAGSPFDAAAHLAALIPVAQYGAEHGMRIKPAVKSGRAAHGGPCRHQDKDGCWHTGHYGTNQAQQHAQHGKRHQKTAQRQGERPWNAKLFCSWRFGRGRRICHESRKLRAHDAPSNISATVSYEVQYIGQGCILPRFCLSLTLKAPMTCKLLAFSTQSQCTLQCAQLKPQG